MVHETEIDDSFVFHSADNLGSIRLHLDENRVANGICLTAYDGGIFCDKLSIDQDGKVEVLDTITPISSQQIKGKCSIKPSEHYPLSANIPAVATGLDVLWNIDGSPSQLVFGCLGQLPNQGGFFAVVFDEMTFRVVEAMEGGYPGSLLFAASPPMELSVGKTQPAFTSVESTQSSQSVASAQSGQEKPIATFEVGGEKIFEVNKDNAPILIVIAAITLLVVALLWVSRKSMRRWVGIVHRGSSFRSRNRDNSDYDFHAVSTNEPGGKVYMELTSTSNA